MLMNNRNREKKCKKILTLQRSNRVTGAQLELKSLEDVWLCVFVVAIQVLCIFRACESFKQLNSATWHPFARPSFELGVYLAAIVASVLLLPALILTGFFKVGSYANDNFRFGQDLDLKALTEKARRNAQPTAAASPLNSTQSSHLIELQEKKKSIQRQEQKEKQKNQSCSHSSLSPVTPNETCNLFDTNKMHLKSKPLSTSSIISSSSAYSDHKHESDKYMKKRTGSFHVLSALHSILSVKNIWRNCMPISNLLHMTISFILIFPSILLVSKQIEYGLTPKGFVHHSHLDFLFMRPLDRFSESEHFLNPSPIYFNLNRGETEDGSQASNANNVNYYVSKNQIKIHLISSSLEDIDQINYSPQISLEMFNYILGLTLFSLRYASTLWAMNKFYSLVFSLHLFFVSCVSLVSIASFEILYKFQKSFSDGIKLDLGGPAATKEERVLNGTSFNSSTLTQHSNSGFGSVVFNLPFATSAHTLQASFLFSMFLFLISSVPVYNYGLYQYRLKFKQLRSQLARFTPHARRSVASSGKNNKYRLDHHRNEPRHTHQHNQEIQQSQCYYDDAKVYLNGSSSTSSAETAASDTALYGNSCNNNTSNNINSTVTNNANNNHNTNSVLEDSNLNTLAEPLLLQSSTGTNKSSSKSESASSRTNASNGNYGRSNYSLSTSPPPLPSQPPPNPSSIECKAIFSPNHMPSTHKPLAATESDLTCSEASSLSLEHSTISLTGTSSGARKTKQNRLFNEKPSLLAMYAPYISHILALLVLLVICANTTMIAYDYICLYQLTSDTIPLCCALMSIAFILWYMFLWLVLTFKAEWSFELTPSFKLNYWNIANKLNRAANNTSSSSMCSTDSSTVDTYKKCSTDQNGLSRIQCRPQQANASQRIIAANANPYSTGPVNSAVAYNEYDFKPRNLNLRGQQLASCDRDRDVERTSNSSPSNVYRANSLSMSNLTNHCESNNPSCIQRQNTHLGAGGGRDRTVFSSSGLLVSDVASRNLHSHQQQANPQSEYETDVTPYENFNTISSICAKNRSSNESLGKKQPSLRRLNPMIMTEQRLAPVFENTTANGNGYNGPMQAKQNAFNTVSSSTENNLNQQLYLLRKSLNKIDKEQAYEATPNYDFESMNKKNEGPCAANNNNKLQSTNASSSSEQNSKGKSSESIYNLSKSKSSLMNYTTISELEKRASAIITNSKTTKSPNDLQVLNVGGSSSMRQSRITNLVPLHLAQQQHQKQQGSELSTNLAENSPKSQSSNASDCISSDSSSSQPSCASHLQETDSGRHSMSESPPNAFYSNTASGSATLSAKTLAGTFTSKCILSSGAAITMSQTMQKLQQQSTGQKQSTSPASAKPEENNFIIKKKCRSTSRDQLREQIREQGREATSMTKSSSFCKSSLPPTSCSANRSHSSERRISSSNQSITVNSGPLFHVKKSNSSINRNCSDL